MGEGASQVARLQGIRAILVRKQQELGCAGGVVMDGRDIGTVVFPDAEVKFYLDATTRDPWTATLAGAPAARGTDVTPRGHRGHTPPRPGRSQPQRFPLTSTERMHTISILRIYPLTMSLSLW